MNPLIIKLEAALSSVREVYEIGEIADCFSELHYDCAEVIEELSLVIEVLTEMEDKE